MRRVSLCAFIVTLATTMAQHPGASAAQNDVAEGSQYGTVARALERLPPTYPKRARREGQEGWVIVSYVIQEDGTVIDPIIDDSSGIKIFEKSVMKVVKKWKFQPATWKGIPIESCRTKTMLRFALETEQRGARRKFIKLHNEVQQLIKSGDLDGAEEFTEEMMRVGRWNNYEYARIWLLKSFIAQQRGDKQANLSALERASSGDGEYIEPELWEKLQPVILGLELELQLYSAAIETYADMKQHPELFEERSDLLLAINGLIDTVQGDNPLSVSTQLSSCSGCEGMWSYAPLRREFTFDDIVGELERLELRCDRKRFRDDIDANLVWTIPESWGKCNLYVFGEAGTTFKFIEYTGPTETWSRNLNSVVELPFLATAGLN